MKTYTTSECIAILEREPEARFEAPIAYYRFPEERVMIEDGAIRFEYKLPCDKHFLLAGRPHLRSDWVRTDKEES